MREPSTRNEANPLPITGSDTARLSGQTNWLAGQAGASVFAPEKDRFRTGLNVGFCPLTVGSPRPAKPFFRRHTRQNETFYRNAKSHPLPESTLRVARDAHRRRAFSIAYLTPLWMDKAHLASFIPFGQRIELIEKFVLVFEIHRINKRWHYLNLAVPGALHTALIPSRIGARARSYWNIVGPYDVPGFFYLESRFRLNPGEQPAIYTAFELCLQECVN